MISITYIFPGLTAAKLVRFIDLTRTSLIQTIQQALGVRIVPIPNIGMGPLDMGIAEPPISEAKF